jgi:hypothetical protein
MHSSVSTARAVWQRLRKPDSCTLASNKSVLLGRIGQKVATVTYEELKIKMIESLLPYCF